MSMWFRCASEGTRIAFGCLESCLHRDGDGDAAYLIVKLNREIICSANSEDKTIPTALFLHRNAIVGPIFSFPFRVSEECLPNQAIYIYLVDWMSRLLHRNENTNAPNQIWTGCPAVAEYGVQMTVSQLEEVRSDAGSQGHSDAILHWWQLSVAME